MKYIGSGLWALAAAYLDVSGLHGVSGYFVFMAVAIAIMGSNKSLVTISNNVNKVGDE